MKYFIVFMPFLCMSMAHKATEQITVSFDERQLIDLWIANEHLSSDGRSPFLMSIPRSPEEHYDVYSNIITNNPDCPWRNSQKPVFSQEEWCALKIWKKQNTLNDFGDPEGTNYGDYYAEEEKNKVSFGITDELLAWHSSDDIHTLKGYREYLVALKRVLLAKFPHQPWLTEAL